MGYIDLKNKNRIDDVLKLEILAILSKRKRMDRRTKGLGSYLIQKAVNNHRTKNKVSFNQIAEKLDDMIDQGLIYYDKYHFFVIEKKGELVLDFEIDEGGKKIGNIMRNLY